MKTRIIAVLLAAGASAFAQGQFGGDVNGDGPGYNGAQEGRGYGAPGYNDGPGYSDAQTYGGAPGNLPPGPAGAYGAPPLCAPGTVWIDGYNGVNGYCSVPPFSGAYWIGPGYYGGRFVAGYWGAPRGFVGGQGFRSGVGFAGHNYFRGSASGGRAFVENNFRGGANGAQSFPGSNSFRGGAPSVRSSGGFSRGGGGRTSGGGHSRGGLR